MYIIDTNVLIGLYRGNEERIDFMRKLDISKPHITIFNYLEFMYGADKEQKNELLDEYDVLSFSVEATDKYIQLDKQHRKKGKPYPIFDMLIASIAIT